MSIMFDKKREKRIGIPEAIYCQGKDFQILNDSLIAFIKENKSYFLTRLEEKIYNKLDQKIIQKLDYHKLSQTAFLNLQQKNDQKRKESAKEEIVIVSGGTADAKIAWEAKRTLEFSGFYAKIILDVGIAGLWRLQRKINEILSSKVVIACAGMEASLPTVLAGLIPQPIIAVPISTGYGVSSGGMTALLSMLASCAPGLVVVNIDNGYGAACAAIRILNKKKE